jgi:hypothetical protein
MIRFVCALFVVIFLLSSTSWASARGSRGGTKGAGAAPDICTSTMVFAGDLARIDGLMKLSDAQAAAFAVVKKIVQDNSDAMFQSCSSDMPLTVPGELASTQKHLVVALAGMQKLIPAMQKFYATLNDQQKALFDGLAYWPDI